MFPADPSVPPALTRWLARWPNTTVERTVIVANDPADYARNAYDQRTINALWGAEGSDAAPGSSRGGGAVDLLRLVGVGESVEMWEVLHYLVRDGLMERVRVLQLELYIGTLVWCNLWCACRVHSLVLKCLVHRHPLVCMSDALHPLTSV